MFSFISDTQECLRATSLLGTKLHFERDLPDQVFKLLKGKLSFCRADNLWSPSFWKILKKLEVDSGDFSEKSEIIMFSLDFESAEKFNSSYGYFNIVKFSQESTELDYSGALYHPYLPDDSYSFGVGTLRVAFVPTSGAWVIWASRVLDLCIIRHQSVSANQLGEEFTSDPALALKWFLAPTFGGDVVPSGFREKFLKNYS